MPLIGFLLLSSATGAGQSPGNASVKVLTPVMDVNGSVAESTASDGRSYPVFRLAESSALVRQVYHVMEMSFARQVIRLDRYARDLLLSEIAGSPPALQAPVYLLMSEEEGGFARQDFWLQDPRGRRRLVRAGYIDLVVTSESVQSGNLEEIFSHELGHQIVRELVGALPPGPSRGMHQSMAVTDYPTAFDEGYAEHFQPLVRDATTNGRLRARTTGRGPDLDLLWISRLDQQLRTDGVKSNRFIHRKALPTIALEPGVDRHSLYLEGETSTTFLDDELRSGQEMMASEGVIATLFYRIVNSAVLRDRRRDSAFYRPFLVGDRVRHPISPYENANLKLFVAMRHAAGPIASGTPPMIALLRSYATAFPDEAREMYTVFLETTRGATASRDLANAFERAATEGRLGNVDAFRPSSRAAFTLLDSIIARVSRGDVAVDADLGPELWLLNPEFKVGQALWSPERTLALTLNLNTATEAELMTIPEVDLATARRIVAVRRADGAFTSLDDLKVATSADLQQTLVRMHEQMASAGSQRRP